MSKRATIFFIFIMLAGINLPAQTATQWRGPNANGIYPETGLLKVWPASGPEIIWQFEGLGEGHSSPALANGTIYLSGMTGDEGFVYALSPDGKLKWKKSYGKEFTVSYPGARSTPVIDDNLLYMYSGLGELTCMDANSGDVKWRKNAFSDFDGANIQWGVTETVVIDGNKLYLTPGGKKNNVVALDKTTGDLIWTSPGAGDLSAYCTPLLIDLPGRKLLVTMTAKHIIGLDASNGKLLWSQEHTNRWDVQANTPVYSNGKIFCFSGWGAGGVMLELNSDGSSVKKAWSTENLDSRTGGAVLVDGYLYGSGDMNREWRCIDWNTGTEKYASKEVGNGLVIYADGMLYCYSERGELALVKATPETFNVISKTKIEWGTAQHWSHPVIKNGRLYLRHGNAIVAYNIKK